MHEMINIWFGWDRFSRDVKWTTARYVEDDWSVRETPDEVLVHTGDPLSWHFRRSSRTAYEPYREASGLFREVASLEPSRDDIREFVRQYGPLTFGQLFVPVDLERRLPRPPKGVSLDAWRVNQRSPKGIEALTWVDKWNKSGVVQGDSLAFWCQLIRELKTYVAVWDAICQRELAVLERHVCLETKAYDTFVSIRDEAGQIIDGPRRFTDENLSDLTLIQAAECGLTSVLSEHLSKGVVPTMYPPESSKRGQLALVPGTLYDAIWLQFVLAFNGNKNFGACEVCGKPFEISPQFARTNRKLCSAACKAKAHRRRREQALSLAAQGRTPKQIAKQVGSQLTTVQKWLAEAKGEE